MESLDRGRIPIVLRPEELYWLGDDEPDRRNDQCAHGNVRFSIGEAVFVSVSDGEGLTVTAAGLFLLRTLTHGHTPSSSVTEGNLLFPCCGHGPEPWSDRFPVLIVGCPGGVDLEIVRVGDSITVRRRDGVEATVSASAWGDAVIGFCDEVEAFYHRSPPRTIWEGEDYDGWRAFWEEWRARRAAAT